MNPINKRAIGLALLLVPALSSLAQVGINRPERSLMLGVEMAGAGGFVPAGDPASTPEHLELLRGGGGTNRLVMSQLQVGQHYYVMAKQDISPDLANPWYFLGGFVASAPNLTAFIYSPPTVTKEFYSLWPGEYSGPRLTIESPTNGAVVSGDVVVRLRVADISPVSLYAYLNGQPLGPLSDLLTADLGAEMGARHAGGTTLTIPAGLLPNGENHLSIVARNHGVEIVPDTNTLWFGNVTSFSTTRDVTIVASNELAVAANPAMSSPDAGPCEFRLETTSAGAVALDVMGVDGSPCRTLNATVSDPNGGIVVFRWDYTRTDGSAYTNHAYAARCTFEPLAAGFRPAAGGGGKTIWLTNVIDRSPLISGSPLLTWMELNATPLERALDALADDVFQNLYDFFSWAIPTLFYTPAEIGQNRTRPVKWKFNEITMGIDVTFFHRFMTNRNFDSWVYFGHCNQQALGFPTAGAPAAGTTVSANDVSNDLGNIYSGYWVNYKRRLRTVIMHGCWTANINGNTNGGSPPVVTEWPQATGTPLGVSQLHNRIYKTAFVGFENTVSPQPTFIEALLYDWPHPNLQTPNCPIAESFAYALDFAWEGDQTYIRSTGPKLLGFPWLPYRSIYDSQLATNDFPSLQFCAP
jgi:hypothetical protein